jgi:dihydroorotase
MPNTEPVMDDSESIKLFKEIIRRDARANVLICGAITKARAGKVLTDVAALKKSDVVALSDDGASVDDDNLMLEALKRTRAAGILMLAHCQDNALFGKGVVNRGPVATRLGLRGISAESEYKRLQRDIGLAQKAASRLHITHISCKESVAAIARAKKEGINLTCDVTPHHLAFSEEAVLGYDTNFKMNPPLRSSADQEALKDGLKDGTIDAIASDHAPHTENEKDIEFERAEFGVIGLETELSAAITGLVETNLLSWLQLVEKLCLNPAKILGIDKPGPYVQGLGKGSLGEGREADIIIVDPQKEWLVSRNNLVSRSKNSAFLGRTLKGLVTHTILAGKVVYSS